MVKEKKIPKTTKTFIFQTGHGKGLARTEIEALLGNCVIDEVEDGFVLEAEINKPLVLQDRMGGIVRITEVLESGPAGMPLNFVEWVSKALKNQFKDQTGKLRFGLSMHPKNEQILKKTLNEAKNGAKRELGNIRFVNKDFQNLSSAQAWNERLDGNQAVELHLFKSETRWYLVKTLTIQNIDWYSFRDMMRPGRDPHQGMFPPKLAQILVNLSRTHGQPDVDVICDPFCGSGTLLQEAWLMGYEPWGCDLNPKAVKYTQENLEWLKKQCPFPLEGDPVISEEDATKLSANKFPKKPFAIVTETWLGPAISEAPRESKRPQIQEEMESLYEAFFSNLSKVLKQPTTVVFTAAYYKDRNDRFFLPYLPAILNKYCTIVPLSEHERPSLFYERKDQIVGREIWKVVVNPA